MKRSSSALTVFLLLVTLAFGFAGAANAQNRNEREVRDLVRSLNSKIDDFRYELDYQLRSSSAARQDVDDARSSVENLKDKLDAFEDDLNQRSENRDDIKVIVAAAQDIRGFLSRNPQNRRIETSWNDVRGLIDRLAGSYGITPDWKERISAVPPVRDRDTTSQPIGNSTDFEINDLSGTYQLDKAKSEDTRSIISGTGVADADRRDLESKITPPDEIAIDIRGSQIIFASSNASPVSLIADGSEKTVNVNGKTVRMRATLQGRQLVVSSFGGDSDFTITFISKDGGRTLKVTRRVTTGYLSETVFADSIYNKTETVAGLGIESVPTNGGVYSSSDPADTGGAYGGAPTATLPRIGEFTVPNGTIITGSLENDIDTKVSQNNDRFKMTVSSPDEFRGAMIEGYISGVGRSGQVSGRSNITFNFERITLKNGKAYDFAGSLQAVKDTNGKTIKVDAEGAAKGDSQTKETAIRGGLGAGLGAVIGAIAGGGKGAAIGAIIGGGAGAGSVVAQGRDDIRLQKGSTITVQASSPVRSGKSDKSN